MTEVFNQGLHHTTRIEYGYTYIHSEQWNSSGGFDYHMRCTRCSATWDHHEDTRMGSAYEQKWIANQVHCTVPIPVDVWE